MDTRGEEYADRTRAERTPRGSTPPRSGIRRSATVLDAAEAVAMTAGGASIYADPDDPRSARLIEANGNLNPGSLRLWQRVLASRPWPTVIDVGVNYGEMLVGAGLPAGATVIGFEPNTRLHPYLERTLREAGITVDLRREAVADQPGTARFAVDNTWSGTSSLLTGAQPEGERWTHRDVPVTTLDDVLGPAPRSFCAKVDVEGFEREVVHGAGRAFSWSEPWAVMLEVAHMSPIYLASLAQRFTVLGLDRRTDRLIRLPGGNGELVAGFLRSSWLYPQDCVLANDAAAAELLALEPEGVR